MFKENKNISWNKNKIINNDNEEYTMIMKKEYNRQRYLEKINKAWNTMNIMKIRNRSWNKKNIMIMIMNNKKR